MEITSAGVAGLFFVGVVVVFYAMVVRRQSIETALASACFVVIGLVIWLWLTR